MINPQITIINETDKDKNVNKTDLTPMNNQNTVEKSFNNEKELLSNKDLLVSNKEVTNRYPSLDVVNPYPSLCVATSNAVTAEKDTSSSQNPNNTNNFIPESSLPVSKLIHEDLTATKNENNSNTCNELNNTQIIKNESQEEEIVLKKKVTFQIKEEEKTIPLPEEEIKFSNFIKNNLDNNMLEK